MSRLLSVIAVAVIVAGCNKAHPTTPDDRRAASKQGTETVPGAKQVTSTYKKAEPPRLTPRHRFKTGIREIAHVTISDDGTRAAASSDGLGNRTQTEVWQLSPEPKLVRAFPFISRALSQDGKHLIRPGDLGSGETSVIEASSGSVICVIADWGFYQRFIGPDRLLLVRKSESIPGAKPGLLRVRIYETKTGKQESGFEIPSTSYARILGTVKRHEELVVQWEGSARIEYWNIGTGKVVRGLTLPKGDSNFEPSPDGKLVSTGGKVYDTTTGAEVAKLENATTRAFVPNRELILGHASWFGNGLKQYTGWRAHDLTKKAIVADLPGGYLFPAISSDGRVMVTMVDRARPELLVWDLSLLP